MPRGESARPRPQAAKAKKVTWNAVREAKRKLRAAELRAKAASAKEEREGERERSAA